jgi:beta-galactosidase
MFTSTLKTFERLGAGQLFDWPCVFLMACEPAEAKTDLLCGRWKREALQTRLRIAFSGNQMYAAGRRRNSKRKLRITRHGGSEVERAKQPSAADARPLTDGRKKARLPRRDALKSLIAGFTAAPLLAAKVLRAQQSGLKAAGRFHAGNTRDQLFDSGWKFHRGDVPGAESLEFDDNTWRQVDLPHDWSIEDLPPFPQETGQGAVWGGIDVPLRIGPFDRYLSEGQRSTGWCVGGIGWYRKRFTADGVAPDNHAEILFEGVYMNSDVWLNGHHLGFHPYGYTSFVYDLTPYLNRQGENVMAVRVRNVGRNSRWYSGSGIYRHVWLHVTGAVRVPLWGVYVTMPEVAAPAATVKVAVKVENREKAGREVTVRVRLLDSKRHVAGSNEASKQIGAGSDAEVEQIISVSAPSLWSPASPHLYRAEVELVSGGKTLDRTITSFGIRKIEADAQHGLRINGEAVKLRGGCMHHDNGLLGSAAIDRAEERRVELMKARGFNAIRCAHNPPSPRFLDACDRLGMVVIDEAFDQWSIQKNPQDYHLYFKDWWRRDIDAMVLRDRNHPSVIFWSIGNEIPERAEPSGVAEAKEIVDEIKRLDDTRLITAAINPYYGEGKLHPWPDTDPAFKYLNVGGYNYQWNQYEKDHERLPQRVMMGTESFPLQAFENWQMVTKHPYVIGDFVWTGMDYLGEAGIGNAQLNSAVPFLQAPMPHGELARMPAANFALIFADYPWFNAYCGDIDLAGEEKPQLLYKRVLWGMSKLEMTVQRPIPEGRKQLVSAWGWPDQLKSWTWPGHEGNPVTVRVYSQGDEVRLLLNGREIGVKPVSAKTQFKAEFEVTYAPGNLKAIALEGGNSIAEIAFKTAGRPAGLRLKADRASLRLDRNDLAYITLEVLDQSGNVVPDAAAPVSFEISGAAELTATGTANPKDVRSFRQAHPVTYHGKCLAIVRPTGSAGSAILLAKSAGLKPARLVLKVSRHHEQD